MLPNIDRACGRHLRKWEPAHLFLPNVTDDPRANILILILVALLTLWFRHCNKQADRRERVIEGSGEFRYTI
jgi:hypothetical protein